MKICKLPLPIAGSPPVPVKTLVMAAAVMVAALMVGSYSARHQYSCHICHNRKEVDSTKILTIPIWRHERATTRFLIPENHNHRWYCYNSNYQWVFGGPKLRCCRLDIYVDRSVAPDGLK